jgi:DNA-binding NarL/FixJ family response regulator
VTSKRAVDATVMRHSIDIAVLDHNLRGGSTLEAAQLLLMQDNRPFIVLMGFDSKAQLDELRHYSPDLLRPFETRRLVHSVHQKYVPDVMCHIMPIIDPPLRQAKAGACSNLSLLTAEK